jgi:hypothetical protein
VWNDYILCTPTDIRARLTTPETLAGITAAPDTPFGVTLVSNTLTSTVPNRLLTWTAIQFGSTGTLPTGLVSGTTYYARDVTALAFRVATVVGGDALTLTGGTGTLTAWNSSGDDFFRARIVIAKEWIYECLLNEMPNRVPMIAWRWQNRKRAQIDYLTQSFRREFELAAKTTLIPVVPGVYDGSTIDLYMLLTMANGLVPRTFVKQGTPINGVSGDYVGEAERGSVLLNMAQDQIYGMYYQAGDKNNVLWQHPNAFYVLNNLLNVGAGRVQSVAIHTAGTGYVAGDTVTISGGDGTCKARVVSVNSGVPIVVEMSQPGNSYSVASNASTTGGTGTGLTVDVTGIFFNIMKNVAVDVTMLAMAQDSSFRNRVHDFPYLQMLGGQSEMTIGKRQQIVRGIVSQILPSIDIDIDGDGKISDFEAELTHNPQGVFA